MADASAKIRVAMAICFMIPHNNFKKHIAFVEGVPGRRVRAVVTEGELSPYDVAEFLFYIFPPSCRG
jgi:hypothetical protein